MGAHLFRVACLGLASDFTVIADLNSDLAVLQPRIADRWTSLWISLWITFGDNFEVGGSPTRRNLPVEPNSHTFDGFDFLIC